MLPSDLSLKTLLVQFHSGRTEKAAATEIRRNVLLCSFTSADADNHETGFFFFLFSCSSDVYGSGGGGNMSAIRLASNAEKKR